MNIIKQLLLSSCIGFFLVGNAIAEAIPQFEYLPRSQIFELAVEKSGAAGDSARSYIRSHQERMAPYLLAVAGDPKFKQRQFAIDLLLEYPFNGNWNEPLEQLYQSNDSVLWRPALEKRIKLVLNGAKPVHQISFPEHNAYPIEKRAFFIERCAPLIDKGLVDVYPLQSGINDTTPVIRQVSLIAAQKLTRYHSYIANAIIHAVAIEKSPEFAESLKNLMREKPFLVLPNLLIYEEEEYPWSKKIPAKQYLDALDLSSRQMTDILVEILSDTSARDQYTIIGHQQNAIRALGKLGLEAKSARIAIEPFLQSDNSQLQPYAVLTMSRIDPDYPKLDRMIGLGLLGIEAREKWEAYRKKLEEEAANSQSEGDGCGGGENEGFEQDYKPTRLIYVEAAKNLGLKAQDCGRALAIAMNEGCFEEAYPVFYSFGEAGMQAYDELIFRCPNVWSHRDEMRALMHRIEPVEVLIRQTIREGITSSQSSGTPWSRAVPLRAMRAMGFDDSLSVQAVGSLFTPQFFTVENEQWTAISYLADIGASARFAGRGLACAFFYPIYHQRPPVTKLILSLGKDAEPVVKSMADLLDSGLVTPPTFNNTMGTDCGDDFLDIIYTVGEPAVPHLVKLASSDSTKVSTAGIVGLKALHERAVSAVMPMYYLATKSPQWRMVWSFSFLSYLDELAWPAFREALVHPDTSSGYGNSTSQAIMSIDSLYYNADKVVQDSVRTLLAKIAEKGREPIHVHAKNKLHELTAISPVIKKE